MELHTIGIDLGKTVFHLVGLNPCGEVVVRKKFSRKQLLHFTANLKVKLIGMEACGGSHFLGRALREQGHEVRLMPAQYVKPYVKTNGQADHGMLLETKAVTILEFLQGLRGSLSVTFEEGTSAAWLHDLLKPHVSHLIVCDPRKNALLKDGSKSDRIDARKLAELLRGNQLKPVYHGEHGLRTLKELGRSYLTLTKDVSRVMSRIKALYRDWAIPCSGTTVYAPRHRAEWLAKISEPGVHLRAQRFYQQLDLLQPVRQEARHHLLSESRKHPAVKLLRQIERFCSLGASWVFSFQPVLPPDCRPFVHLSMEVGQAINAVTGTRRLGCLCFLSMNLNLCRCRQHDLTTVAQRFVDFSAHPQSMQQNR
jgi:transposase